MKTIERTLDSGDIHDAFELAGALIIKITREGHSVLYTNFIDVTGAIFIVIAYREGGADARD